MTIKLKERDSVVIYSVYIYQPIGLVGRVFANGLWGRGSIPDRVLPKTQKMVFDASLLNTQHYKVQIKNLVWLGFMAYQPL